MGTVAELHCPQCGKKIRFSLGAGMLDYQRPWIKQQSQEAREGKYGEAVQAAALRYPTADITREEYLFRCSNCGNPEGGTLWEVKNMFGAVLLTIKPSCPRCGGKMTIVNPDKEGIKCPDCQTVMRSITIALFD